MAESNGNHESRVQRVARLGQDVLRDGVMLIKKATALAADGNITDETLDGGSGKVTKAKVVEEMKKIGTAMAEAAKKGTPAEMLAAIKGAGNGEDLANRLRACSLALKGTELGGDLLARSVALEGLKLCLETLMNTSQPLTMRKSAPKAAPPAANAAKPASSPNAPAAAKPSPAKPPATAQAPTVVKPAPPAATSEQDAALAELERDLAASGALEGLDAGAGSGRGSGTDTEDLPLELEEDPPRGAAEGKAVSEPFLAEGLARNFTNLRRPQQKSS